MVNPAPGTAHALVSSARARAALVRRLTAATSSMTTAALDAMEQRHPWFRAMGADERSWITVVARTGIDGFVEWFSAEPGQRVVAAAMFDAAPRALTRKITLRQTVDLVRTTIGVVEEQIQTMPRGDRDVLGTAITIYSREVAFGAAEVYARAAEQRGTWDARLEALVVDAVMRAESDETLVSRASTLGWQTRTPVTVLVGAAPPDAGAAADDVRRDAERWRVSALTAVQGERLVVILASADLGPGDPQAAERALTLATKFRPRFGSGQVIVGPVVDDLVDASVSARAAMSGHRAAIAWPEGPAVIAAEDLLPERALAGDRPARRRLALDIFGALQGAGGDLLETCASFLDHGGSVEATARALFVHPNTVRYRLKRIQDVTGYSPAVPREAYVLRLAITLGRLGD